MMVESLTAVHSEAGKNIYDSMAQLIVEIFARRIPSFAYNSAIQRLVSVRESIQKRFPIIESEEATARYEPLLPNVTEDAINQLRTAISLVLRDIIDDEGNPKNSEKGFIPPRSRIEISDPKEIANALEERDTLSSALEIFFESSGGGYESGLRDVDQFVYLTFYPYGRLFVAVYHDTSFSNKREFGYNNPAYNGSAYTCEYEQSCGYYVGCAGDRDKDFSPLFFQHLDKENQRLSKLSDMLPKIFGGYKLVLQEGKRFAGEFEGCVLNLKETVTFLEGRKNSNCLEIRDRATRDLPKEQERLSQTLETQEFLSGLAIKLGISFEKLAATAYLVPDSIAGELAPTGLIALDKLANLEKHANVYTVNLLEILTSDRVNMEAFNAELDNDLPFLLRSTEASWGFCLDQEDMRVTNIRLVSDSIQVYEARMPGVSEGIEYNAGDIILVYTKNDPFSDKRRIVYPVPRAQAERFLDLPAVGTAPSVENDPGIQLG